MMMRWLKAVTRAAATPAFVSGYWRSANACKCRSERGRNVAVRVLLLATALMLTPGAALADDVNIVASTNAGVNLDSFAGTTARISPGVTVTNAGLTLMCASFPGVCASTRAWTLNNEGTIGPNGAFNAIRFNAGGTVINSGTINGSNGIWIQGGSSGTVNNLAGGTIQGNFGAIVIQVPGTVTNAGTITSNGQAIGLNSGGTFTNLAGGLVQGHGGNNAVAVVLGTSRTVINSGTIQSNDTGFATGVSLQNGTLTNNAGGQILGAYNAVWANGASATSITNHGLLEASKAEGGGSAIEVDGGGTVVNTGTVRSLTSDATTTDAGIQFTGAGSITNSGSILSATGGRAILFTGSATHTLNLGTGSVLGGNVQGGSGTDNLVLTGTGLEAINKFLGFETLSMQGADWTLNNSGSFATSAQIQSGILRANGQLTTPAMTVQSGGTLAGTGTIVGAVNVNGGTLSPGNSIGTLTVQGSLVFTAAASYLVEVSTAAADRVNVMGTATPGGATVNAVFAPGAYVARQYTIVNATGGVAGTFSALANTNLPSGFQSSLSYDANNVYLNLALDPGPVIPGGLNVNQQNVANALTGFFNTTGGIPMVFGALTPFGLTVASGELPTRAQQTTFDAMDLFLGLLTDPFVAGRDGGIGAGVAAAPFAGEGHGTSGYAAKDRPRPRREREAYSAMSRKAPVPVDPLAQRWSVWAAGFGGSQTTDGQAALGSNTATSRLAAGALGADYRFSPNTLAGFALAGGGTAFSVANGLGSGRSDLFQAGAFLRHTAGPAYISAALAYGWQDITTDRTVAIAGVDRLRAQFNANTWSGRVEGGYRFVTQGFGVTPYAAARSITFGLPFYAETVVAGANTFALNYAAKDVTASRSELGLRTDRSFAMQGGILALRSRLAWAHEFNPDRNIAATFQTLPGASFVVNGAAQARDAALTTASAEMKWLNGFSLAATFEGEFSNLSRSYAGKGVARYAW
ncbi:MAG: autotransporter domain-containing protein [Pseudomonadota bacterium]